MATIEISKRDIGKIRKNDRIIAIDGRSVEFRVVAPLHTLPSSAVEAIGCTLPNGREANIYPNDHIERSVTIVRADRKPPTRTIDGITFVSVGEKHWETTVDGVTYAVAYEEAGVTECDNPHPMKDGGYCPGAEQHFYWQWSFGRVDGPVAYADTFRDAASDLVQQIRSGRV